jgi:hypothetical protein
LRQHWYSYSERRTKSWEEPTGLIAVIHLMPPSIPVCRLDGTDVSFPSDIWGFSINGVAVNPEMYTKETALGPRRFASFRTDGDFFFVTTKSFGKIRVKVIEEKKTYKEYKGFRGFDSGPADIKCEIWAMRDQATAILDQLTKTKQK